MVRPIQIFLGAVFIFSGVLKGVDIAWFLYTVNSYGFGAAVTYASQVIPVLEVVIGLMLVSGFGARLATGAGFVLVLLLTGLFAYGLFGKGIHDCGCFGSLFEMPAWLAFTRNIIMLVLSGWAWRNDKQVAPPINVARVMMITVPVALAAWSVGYSFHEPLYRYSKTTFEGQPLSETPLKTITGAAADSTMAIFIFSPSCVHCWNAVENVKKYSGKHAVDKVVGIAYPTTEKEWDTFQSNFEPNFEIRRPAKEIVESLTESFPKLILVKNDSIKKEFTSDIPAFPVIEQILR